MPEQAGVAGSAKRTPSNQRPPTDPVPMFCCSMLGGPDGNHSVAVVSWTAMRR